MGAKAVNSDHRQVPNMGHVFKEELFCVCGISWDLHQWHSIECTERHPSDVHKGPERPDLFWLGALCKQHGVSHRALARVTAAAESQMTLVWTGRTGISLDKVEEVRQVAIQKLHARGVAFAEGAG